MPRSEDTPRRASRAIKILFASQSCYLDSSGGAAVASRAMMEALDRRGFAVEALTGMMLDADREVDLHAWLIGHGTPFEMRGGGAVTVDARGLQADVPVHYRLTFRGVPVTLHRGPTARLHTPDTAERRDFLRLTDAVLDRFRPDVLINYGGDVLAHEVRSRARARGAAVVFPLHNLGYTLADPFATANAVTVPSRFAANHYRETLGLDCTILPNLIDGERVKVETRDPRYLTFVNPSTDKGVYVLARIADELGRRRSDIPLLVVESRGTEASLADCGLDLRSHGTVHLMAHTPDPRRFWRLTRLCVMPSLVSETQGLVAVEAMVNGIPVIASDRGALPETLGDAGTVLPLPARLTPKTRVLPTPEEVAPWVEAIIRFWDDPVWYAEQSRRALGESQRWAPEKIEPPYVRFFESIGRGAG